MNIFGTKNNSNEISLLRSKLCSFFLLTIIYAFFIGMSSVETFQPRQLIIKDLLINITVCVCFFIPYWLTILDVIKEYPKIKRIFEIKEENKIRDLIQIIWMILLFIPFSFFMLLIIASSINGFNRLLEFILENCRF